MGSSPEIITCWSAASAFHLSLDVQSVTPCSDIIPLAYVLVHSHSQCSPERTRAWAMALYFSLFYISLGRCYRGKNTHPPLLTHASSLTLKSPRPLGFSTAAHRNAPSPQPFISRNVCASRSTWEVVACVAVSFLKTLQPVPCITPPLQLICIRVMWCFTRGEERVWFVGEVSSESVALISDFKLKCHADVFLFLSVHANWCYIHEFMKGETLHGRTCTAYLRWC